MSIPFRKTIPIAPGIRVNLSKCGVSAAVGSKGVGRGVRANVTILGSGIFYRKKLPIPWPGGSKNTGVPSFGPDGVSEGRNAADGKNGSIQVIIDIQLRPLPLTAPFACTLSGYGEPGREEDQYLFSLRVHRDRWDDTNSFAPAGIDPGEAVGGFETRRNMTKTGIFKSVEPFSL
ncbi:MAG: hypothetical protein PWP47_1011 [Synergistaceae bacterium]|nr:hypothetical protein [Synergistaceae bacterium]